MRSPRILTIGVYGLSEDEFFGRLKAANVDLFCDIRRRRGMRGREYAFANSLRLQARLDEMGIAYRHLPELAPTQAMLQAQAASDKAHHIARRKRTELDPAFVAAYRAEILSHFSAQAFLDELPAGVQNVVFFCVEATPDACHRSLVAQAFADLGLEVVHL